MVAIDEQSPDIAQGVDESFEAQHGDTDPIDRIGAGDQGMMFGYATRETDELMPLPIMLAHKLAKRLAAVRKADVLPYLRPDGKTQVTVRYELDEHGVQRPVEIERVLISTQHRDGLDAETLIKPDLLEHVVEPILHADYRDLFDPARLGAQDFFYVNPTGKFVVGGPMGDTGLTGRKIIVDTYGGAAPHGGGAFSGKDPTKVDRSAAYAARYVAKNVVAAGLADRCQVQVAYAIGVAHPMSVLVDTFGTEAEGLSNDADLASSCSSTSTCGPARSSATSTCAGRSTGRPRRTATSAGPTRGLHLGAHRQGRCAPRRRGARAPRRRSDARGTTRSRAVPSARRLGLGRNALDELLAASVRRARISSARGLREAAVRRRPSRAAPSPGATHRVRRARRRSCPSPSAIWASDLPRAQLGPELLRRHAEVLRRPARGRFALDDPRDECLVLLGEPLCGRRSRGPWRSRSAASASRPARASACRRRRRRRSARSARALKACAELVAA